MRVKIFTTLFLLFLFLLTSGCGFHLRQAAQVPPQYRVLYLDAPNLHGTFLTDLSRQLRSMSILLTNTPQEAPVHLRILSLHYTHDNPNIVTNSFAVSYTYTLSITVALLNSREQIISGPKTFSASNTVTLNANQVLVPGADTVTKQQLQREVITLIYYWMIEKG